MARWGETRRDAPLRLSLCLGRRTWSPWSASRSGATPCIRVVRTPRRSRMRLAIRLVGDAPLMGRRATPEAIASGVLSLAPDESSCMAGSEMVIDGGPIGSIWIPGREIEVIH